MMWHFQGCIHSIFVVGKFVSGNIKVLSSLQCVLFVLSDKKKQSLNESENIFFYLGALCPSTRNVKLVLSFPLSQISWDVYQSLSSLLHSCVGKLISEKINSGCSANTL